MGMFAQGQPEGPRYLQELVSRYHSIGKHLLINFVKFPLRKEAENKNSTLLIQLYETFSNNKLHFYIRPTPQIASWYSEYILKIPLVDFLFTSFRVQCTRTKAFENISYFYLYAE
jgi:hypothetical protein